MQFYKVIPGAMLVMVVSGCFTDKKEVLPNTGDALYSNYCAGCHKESGQGNFIQGIPANAKTVLNKEQIVELITTGSSVHKDMPTFPQLSVEQAENIADHLLTLVD